MEQKMTAVLRRERQLSRVRLKDQMVDLYMLLEVERVRGMGRAV